MLDYKDIGVLVDGQVSRYKGVNKPSTMRRRISCQERRRLAHVQE